MISALFFIIFSMLLFLICVKYFRLKTKINSHEEIMTSILSNIGDGIIVTNPYDKTVKVNSIVKNIVGGESNNLIGLPCETVLKTIYGKISDSSESKESNPPAYNSSEYRCIKSSEQVIKNKKGEVASKVVILHNLFECTTAHQIIHVMAHYDSLTGLANRSHIKEILSKAVKTAEENKKQAAVVFIDLDNFKMINDTLGHEIGDMVLKHVSSIIQECSGDKAYAGRLGGDEFLILMPDINISNNPLKSIKNLMKSLNKPLNINDNEIFITASAGISIYPLHGTDPKVLLRNADIAMYTAKNKGKKSYMLYKEDMTLENVEKYEMIKELKRALNNNEFTLYYQPKVNIMSNEIIGLEALIRWVHPENGIIPPSDFIPLAEETGLILPMGEWVLREACSQNKKWQVSGFTPMRIAVNLSTKQFEHNDLVGTVKRVLKETGLDAKWLELEITESMSLECFECALIKLEQLKKIGVTVAIDDFGTGYSSFKYLRLLPVDTLKIDKTFLDNIISNPSEQSITAAMIDLGKRLNLSIVAEGVEFTEQVYFLREHQCNIAQGFLYSKPLPAEEMEKLFHFNFENNKPL